MTGADEYEWVQGDARLDAFCFTAVSGVEREQVIRGFLGDPGRKRLTGIRLDEAWLGLPHSCFDVPSPY